MTAPAPPRVVTVDGASGSGKSTLGRRLAMALKLPLVDTGLFYRALMVAAIRAGIDAGDHEALAHLATRTTIDIETDPNCPAPELLTRVDGRTAGNLLRDPSHAQLLSRLSSLPAVRAAVLGPQRALASSGAVAVGRDCGTVVFPAAPVKLYLEAPAGIREQRRKQQLEHAGATVDAAALRDEVSERDRIDSVRSASPLKPAPDAHRIDTGRTSIDEVLAIALDLCARAGLGTSG
jgi:cytidylate kinase